MSRPLFRFLRFIKRRREPRPPSTTKGQHLHNKIGNAIGECKKQLYDQLKAGENLALACDKFLNDVTRELRAIVARETGGEK